MSKKVIIANFEHCGGKAYIYFNSLSKKKMLRLYAEFLNKLNGVFLACDDVNISMKDIYYVRKKTKFTVGFLEKRKQIPATSYGVYCALKKSYFELFGNTLKDVKIGVQGIGKVGYELCLFLKKEGAKLFIQEINYDLIRRFKNKNNFNIVDPSIDFATIDVDILVPCAMDNVITYKNIEQIKAKLICGGANNQLEDISLEEKLYEKKVSWIPDFLANCGGVIDLSIKKNNYSKDNVYKKIKIIEEIIEITVQESLKKKKSIYYCLNEYLERVG